VDDINQEQRSGRMINDGQVVKQFWPKPAWRRCLEDRLDAPSNARRRWGALLKGSQNGFEPIVSGNRIVIKKGDERCASVTPPSVSCDV
jgi:hypothetical protein